ncbi:MAG: HlyD family secretion protein [Verrucomicrobiales bacterium]|jgi:HlyD family secretion protein
MMTLGNMKGQWSAHRRIIAAIVGIGLVSALAWKGGFVSSDKQDFAVYETQRTDFIIRVKESGTLKPVKKTTLRNEVNGSSRIVYLVPEGTVVDEGELLVELDASSLEERAERRELSYKSRQASQAAAQSRYVIVKSDAESDVRKAQRKVDFARMDMSKFDELEKDQLLRDAELDVMLAEEALSISEERYQNSIKLVEGGFETSSTLSKDRLAVTSNSARVEKAKSNEEVTARFDMVRQQKSLSAALIEGKKNLLRTQRESNQRVTQAEARLKSAEASLTVAKLAFDEAVAQLSAAKILAPHAGMVVYGGSASKSSRESMIEEGAMVRSRQELITIPDTSAMMISVKVHETMASDVKQGQDALITLDAIPDKVFRGRVSRVALFPDRKNFWSGNNSLVYSVDIKLTDLTEDIYPGASGKAQIVVHYLEDVITVPIDAVTTIEGRQIVEVQMPDRTTETRPVRIGLVNDQQVEVISGLKEGELVVMRDAG